MMLDPETIFLPNNQVTKIYSADHNKIRKVIRACDKKALSRSCPLASEYQNTCVLKVTTRHYVIYLLLNIFPTTPEAVKMVLALEGVNRLLDHTLYLVYNNQACWWADADGQLLLGSIKEGVAPWIYSLTHR